MVSVNSLLERPGRPPLETIEAGDSVKVTMRAFSGSRFRCLPVTHKGALVGIVTIRDLLSFIAERGAAGLDAPLAEAMTRAPTAVSVTDDVEKAHALFDGRFNHLPVVNGDELVGVITPADVLTARLGDVRALATDLEHYIMGR